MMFAELAKSHRRLGERDRRWILLLWRRLLLLLFLAHRHGID